MKAKKVFENTVYLTGRVSGTPSQRSLPSGDEVVEFRLVIERDDRAGVDTLDIASWSSILRKRAMKFADQDWVSIEGVIRRRFWKAGKSIGSRWQVEARQLVRH
ncbi:MAG: single-stranded DNA-binding protein [Actinomycetales bacterium]